MVLFSVPLWWLLGPEGQKNSFLCHWLKTGESYPDEAQSLCPLAYEAWSSGIVNTDVQSMKLSESTSSARVTYVNVFYCLFIWFWVKFTIFFLPFSKLWKRALSPWAILQIRIGKSLHLFHSRTNLVVVFLQSCELHHMCLWGENPLLECKSFHIFCLQWGFFLPYLFYCSDTTSHISSLRQSRNCHSVHSSVGRSDGEKRKA